MKKLCTFLLATSFCLGSAAIDQDGEWYLIRTSQDLVDYSNIVNNENNHAKARLMNDIDMSGVENFTPIGLFADNDGAQTTFQGEFNGNGFVVKNMTVKIENYEVGMFSRIQGGSVYNLGVVNSHFESTDGKRAGALGGEILFITVSGCFGVNNEIVTTSDQKGGLAGEAAGDTRFSRCYTDYSVLSGNLGLLIDNSKQNVPVEDIMSGKLCFEMNNFHTYTPLWRQDLKNNGYPVVSSNAPQVTKLLESDTYTNEHNFVDGVCRECVDFFYQEDYITPAADGYFHISTPEQLMWFSVYACHFHQGAKAKLTADIDMSGIKDFYGIGLYEDGGENYVYAGTFDGQGHVVSNLTVYRDNKIETGFFGRASGANISNIGFMGDITITNTQGIRAGVLGGELERCTINNVFVRANSITYNTTNAQKGPFGGEASNSTFTGCYTTESTFVGGLGAFNKCFNNAEGYVDANAATGKLCAELGTGWYQNIDNGQPVDEWPTLNATHAPVFPSCDGLSFSNTSGHNYLNGICQNEGCLNIYEEPGRDDELDAFTIGNLGQLIRFSQIVNTQNQNANGSLVGDIDMEFSDKFSPIGLNNDADKSTPFRGRFYGNNHVIRNIYVKTDCEGGLFSRLIGGYIENLGIENGHIESTANLRCGAIVGEHHANAWLKNCFARGNFEFVTAHEQKGGLCGEAATGFFENCYTTLPVISCAYPGDGRADNCYEGVTAELAASGELCYKLGAAFRQNIGEDAYPELDQTHGIVKVISEAGYATMYIPEAVDAPEGVEVYTGSIYNDKLALNAVEGSVPAWEPVVLKGAAGFYSFKPAAGAEKSVTVDFSAMGFENTQELSGTITVDDLDINFDLGEGVTTPKYYNSGTAARIYGGNVLSVYALDQPITKIEFNFGKSNAPTSSDAVFNSGEFDFETYTWTGNAETVTLTRNAAGGHYRLVSMIVTYVSTPANIEGNDLLGAAEDIEAAGKYVLAQPEGKPVGFYLADKGTIKEGKAYLEGAAGVKAFYPFEEEGETGIESLTPTLSEGEGVVYDLAGRKVNSQFSIFNSQLKNGIFIIDGKKVLR